MERIPQFSILQKDYIYLGEGNSNIVLSLRNTGLLVRLRKSETELIEDKSALKNNELKVLKLEAEFYEKVMRTIIGTDYVHPPKIFSLNEIEVNLLNEELKSIRPLSRLHKDLKCKFATLSLDYTSNEIFSQSEHPSLCIEIKCKQGWMPDYFLQYGKCMFCMNQFLKLKQQKISTLSGYCPLDLFSGDLTRMKKALMELIINPQNNLRVFTSGKLIFGEGISYISLTEYLSNYFANYLPKTCNILNVFTNIIIKSILNQPNNMKNEQNCGVPFIDFSQYLSRRRSIKTQSCNFSSEVLPFGSILKNILSVQLLERGHIIEETDQVSDYGYVEEILHNFVDYSSKCNETSFAETLEPVHKYMIACSAKDCSIMIALKPLHFICDTPLNGNIIVNENEKMFITKIGVIDLDPKPIYKIKYHRKRDEEVVESFLNAI